MSSAPLQVLIADDEPHALEGMAALVSEDADLVVCAQCAAGYSAVDAIRSLEPDIVLLDIQMPGLDGFGVLREIGADAMPAVVFVTAYDEFALRAFEVHAVEYVLKPFADRRFHEALAHAKAQARGRALQTRASQLKALLDGAIASRDSSGSPAFPPSSGSTTPGVASTETRWMQRLPLRNDGSVIYVGVNEIEWIEAADYYSRVHARRRAFMVRETLAMFETRLDPSKFFRTHRSAIINLDCVREVQSMFRGESVAILQSGAKVRVAKPRRSLLERALVGGGINLRRP